MDHKYKSLLQNIPTRHIIAAIDDATSIKLHLTRFRDVDIVNFFILGKLSVVKSVLDHANSNKLFGRKYAWHVITQVNIVNARTAEPRVSRSFCALSFFFSGPDYIYSCFKFPRRLEVSKRRLFFFFSVPRDFQIPRVPLFIQSILLTRENITVSPRSTSGIGRTLDSVLLETGATRCRRLVFRTNATCMFVSILWKRI